MSSFKDLRIVDNFYQTSLFFPMPVVLISTLTDDGKTTCGPYSLVQPFYIAGKDYYAMLLSCRNSSNTAQNLIKHKKCVLNFLPDKKSYFKETVRLGWPGDTPEEKMKDFKFTLEDGLMKQADPEKLQGRIDNICMGRLAEPEDIANACMFLISDLSSYISGQVLAVDGCTIL